MDEKENAASGVSEALPAKVPSGGPMARLAWIFALIIGLVLGFAGARYGFKDQAKQRYDQLKTEFDVTLAQKQYDLTAVQARLDALQGQLAVEESTRKSLEASLQATQGDLARSRDQLAFFDQLLPPGPSGSISVRALDIVQHGPTLQYRVLLMRNAPGSEMFNGLMEFVANGLQKGKSVKIALKPAQAKVVVASADAKAAGNQLALSFDQFQRSEGVLSIPDGFIPKTVTVHVLEGKTVRVSRTVNLPPAD